MPRNHERVAIVNKLRENARKCKVDLVREDAGREQVTAMLNRIRRLLAYKRTACATHTYHCAHVSWGEGPKNALTKNLHKINSEVKLSLGQTASVALGLSYATTRSSYRRVTLHTCVPMFTFGTYPLGHPT